MIETFISILIVYIVYYLVSITRFDKFGHVKKKKSDDVNKSKSKKKSNPSNDDKLEDYLALPNEAKYFIKKYNVDLEKVNLRGILKLIGLILGIDITIVSFIVFIMFDNIVVQILLASVLVIPIYLISIKILANNFKKRGLIKDV